MAGAAAHAPEVAARIAPFHTQMATLAFCAQIGKGCQLGIGLQPVQFVRFEGFRHYMLFFGENVRMFFGFHIHVRTVDFRADSFQRAGRVLKEIIGPAVVIALQRSKGPGSALDLAGFRHHQAGPLRAHPLLMALAAGSRIHPRGPGVCVKFIGPAHGRKLCACALVCHGFRSGRRVAAMAYGAAVRVFRSFAARHDLPHHPRVEFSDGFNSQMAAGTGTALAGPHVSQSRAGRLGQAVDALEERESQKNNSARHRENHTCSLLR